MAKVDVKDYLRAVVERACSCPDMPTEFQSRAVYDALYGMYELASFFPNSEFTVLADSLLKGNYFNELMSNHISLEKPVPPKEFLLGVVNAGFFPETQQDIGLIHEAIQSSRFWALVIDGGSEKILLKLLYRAERVVFSERLAHD